MSYNLFPRGFKESFAASNPFFEEVPLFSDEDGYGDLFAAGIPPPSRGDPLGSSRLLQQPAPSYGNCPFMNNIVARVVEKICRLESAEPFPSPLSFHAKTNPPTIRNRTAAEDLFLAQRHAAASRMRTLPEIAALSDSNKFNFQTFEHLNGIGTDGRSYTWEARNSTDENGSTIHSVRCAIDNLTKTSWCVRPAGHSEDVPRTIKYSSSANRDVFEQQWRLNAPFFLLVKDAEECDRCLAAGAAPVSLEGGEKK